jgi:hypothetical protein
MPAATPVTPVTPGGAARSMIVEDFSQHVTVWYLSRLSHDLGRGVIEALVRAVHQQSRQALDSDLAPGRASSPVPGQAAGS